MFVFGHLGIGNKIASPWSKRLPKVPLFLGMLLPDVIDKTLYYGGLFLSNHFGVSMGIITCTRTFGHTGILLFLILLCGFLFRSRWLSALGLGAATHLLLDCALDHFSGSQQSSALIALCWPLLDKHFFYFHFNSIEDHLIHLETTPILFCELIGLSFIGWDYWKSAYRAEINKTLFSKRWRRLKKQRPER